jgi:transcriptional regulator with XRE-family HTH domain
MKIDGANLAAARERVFMSQEELAEALGMNPYVIIGLETSERTEVRDNLGKDLAEILLTSFPAPPKPVDKNRPDLEDLAEEE